MIICCSATTLDKDYLDYSLVLYLSFRKYHPTTHFHLHIIQSNKDTTITSNTNLPIIVDTKTPPSNTPFTPYKDDCNLFFSTSYLPTTDKNNIRGYATNIKANLIPYLIEKKQPRYNIVLWCGATSIIRADLTPLFEIIKTHRMVAYYSHIGRREDAKGWKGGILGFRKSKKAREFLNSWNRATFKHGILKCRWFQDQHLLNNIRPSMIPLD